MVSKSSDAYIAMMSKEAEQATELAGLPATDRSERHTELDAITQRDDILAVQRKAFGIIKLKRIFWYKPVRDVPLTPHCTYH